MARKSVAAPLPLGHPADRAVFARDPSAVPAEQAAGYEAVVAAFAHFEAGRDDDARAALQPIGLASAFLEWKLLVRGLIAHTAGDDATAGENWKRLSADRLPARLAATATAAPAANELADKFRQLRKELGRDQPLTKAWKLCEAVVPVVRRDRPALLPRLARCLYRAVVRHGEQADVPKYKKLFGTPADDPQFDRLQALACEDTGNTGRANEHWLKYEKWLATHPAGWPPAIADRARAILLHRVGRNVEKAEGEDDSPAASFMELMNGRSKPTGKPDEFFRRSAALAPDWPAPAHSLFDRYARAGTGERAESVANELLARRPDDIPMLRRLAALHTSRSRPADALLVLNRALAANPLDRGLRDEVGLAYLSAARFRLIAGDAAAADALLDAGRETAADTYPSTFLSLRAVAARKNERKADAERFEERALAAPNRRLSASLYLSADGLLAKLKPADRKVADARLKAAFDTPVPTPYEVNMLYGAWALYSREGLAYRGHKTQEAKILALAARSLGSDAGKELDYEVLLKQIAGGGNVKHLLALAPKLAERFPTDPVFPLVEAEALVAKNPSRLAEMRANRLLDKAIRLAEQSPEPRHKAAGERAEAVKREIAGPADFFRFLLNNRG